MKPEWPVGAPAAEDGAQPLLPLAFDEHVAVLLASPALAAFARKRATQMLTHGHTAEADLERTLDRLATEAKARMHAFLDFVGPHRMNLPRGRREQCLRYIEVAGALLMALWDRCQVEVPEE
jgi:hypothetical protein